MLHIFGVILRIIGILLLAILVLVIVLVAAVLFVPVRYRIYGEYKDRLDVQGRVSFLGPFIRLSVKYNDMWEYKLRIFGIPVRKSRIEKPDDYFDDQEDDADVYSQQEFTADRTGQEDKADKKDKAKREVSDKQSLNESDGKESQDTDAGNNPRLKGESHSSGAGLKMKTMKAKVRRIFDIIRQIHALRTDVRVKSGMHKAFLQIKQFLAHVRPRKLRGYIHFGMEDPSYTGQLLGIIAIIRSMWGCRVRIQPEFEEKILEAQLKCKGYVQGIVLARLGFFAIFDKDIRYMLDRGRGALK